MSLPLLIRNIQMAVGMKIHFNHLGISYFPKKSRECLKETLFLATHSLNLIPHHILPPLHFLIPSLPPFPTNTCILTVTLTRGRVAVYRIKKNGREEGRVVVLLFIDVISTSANTWIWRELFHLETWDSLVLDCSYRVIMNNLPLPSVKTSLCPCIT